MDEAGWWFVVLLVVLGVAVYLDRTGEALGREQEGRVYALNERLRLEKGKSPVPWRGSVAVYNEDCRKADG